MKTLVERVGSGLVAGLNPGTIGAFAAGATPGTAAPMGATPGCEEGAFAGWVPGAGSAAVAGVADGVVGATVAVGGFTVAGVVGGVVATAAGGVAVPPASPNGRAGTDLGKVLGIAVRFVLAGTTGDGTAPVAGNCAGVTAGAGGTIAG